MLVISTAVEDDGAPRSLADVEAQITSGGGTLERNDDWHARPLAYEIRHQNEGEYHLLQFTGPPALLEALSHNLRIDDGVLRFRIIKVVPGHAAAARRARRRRSRAPAGRPRRVLTRLSRRERPERGPPSPGTVSVTECATACEAVPRAQRFRPFCA